ncbi:anti-sigma factor family protein [Cellulomonas alba]|uniref:Zf-HC2 domain-containing protein n=1 Tax=Cellulomonas alba TaxID=3053467 RepID=A0ABT7SAV4_9CELL|nr:zf-HC2 domain-containing protein [Cellulomonas alba]MDM7853308.1 zf-HC2 domain-containing protein [Cellulomonas alba]
MTSPDPFREWDAAYVLGALEPADRRAYEDHLRTCDECREAVAELAGIPGVLRLLPADEAGASAHDADAPGLADVIPIADVARSARRHRRRRTTLVAAAAGVLLVGGVAGGFAAAGDHGSPAPSVTVAAQHLQLQAADASGVEADLTMSARAWGTRLDWSCTYPAPGAGGLPADYEPTYELVVVQADGTPTVVATWAAHGGSAHGLGASTSVPTASIRSIEIRTTDSASPLAVAHV